MLLIIIIECAPLHACSLYWCHYIKEHALVARPFYPFVYKSFCWENQAELPSDKGSN